MREKSAGAIIFRREPAKNSADAKALPDKSDEQKKETIFYLLLHYPGINRKGGHWEFAKGHIEEGEDYEKTVRREVFEETGLKDIKILPGFKEHIKYFFRGKEDHAKSTMIFKLVTFFIAETKTRDVKLSLEHDGFLWLQIDDAIRQVTYKNAKELLKKSSAFINDASLGRNQTGEVKVKHGVEK